MLKNMYAFIHKRKLHHYFYIFVFVIVLTYILSHSYFGVCIGFPTTNKDSAKYLISTIIQSEAAILAIVITLSLVAVQQTASSYSTRVIEVFKNINTNPDFYLLMGIYLSSIIYEMWVLKQIADKDENISNFTHSLFNSFEAHIWICYALGAFSLLSLVPYIRNTLDLLKPSSIIERISEQISQETIESFISTRMSGEGIPIPELPEEKYFIKEKEISSLHYQINIKTPLTIYEDLAVNGNSDNNPIQQIFDILIISQIKYDHVTSKYGILKIITCTETFTEDKILKKFHTEIVKSFSKFAIFSVVQRDFDSSLLLIGYLEDTGIKAVEQNIVSVVNTVLKSLTDISIVATEQRLEDLAIWATVAIRNIGIKALNIDLIDVTLNKEPYNPIVTEIEMNFRFFGKRAAEQKLEKETLFIVQSLRDIGRESINKKLIFETRQSIKYLVEVGRSSVRHELEDTLLMIGLLLDELGVAALELDPGEKATKQELDNFEVLIVVSSTFICTFGKLAAEQNFKYIAEGAVTTLKKVGMYVAKRKLVLATTESLSSIKNIGIILAEQGIDHAVETVVLSLRQIGEISIQNKISNQADNALLFINEIGELIVKRNMHQSIKSVVLSFDSIGQIAFQNNFMNIVNGMIIPLERLGIKAAEQKMDSTVKNIIIVLKNIGEVSINYSEYAVRQTIQSIEEIGKLSVAQKLEYSIECAVVSIREIGFKAILKNMSPVIYQSRSSLRNIKASAIDTKLFDKSIIVESLEELEDNITIYDEPITMPNIATLKLRFRIINRIFELWEKMLNEGSEFSTEK